MEFDLIKVITDLGIPVALVVYFLVKDWKFTGTMVATNARIEHLLTRLEEGIDKEVE